MRGICHLSRRWHQQFCLSPSFAAHQRCLQHLQPLQPIRRYRQVTRGKVPRKAPSTSFGDVKFREFEQSGDDESTRVRVHDPLDMESRKVEEELKELEQELATMREGPFGRNSEFMQSFPPEEREELLKALEEEGVVLNSDEELLSPEELDEIARAADGDKAVEGTQNPLKVTLSIPTADKLYVKRFNMALQEAEDVESNARPYLALWKWYLKCQLHVSNFRVILPDAVWHFLWKSQSSPINFRAKHLPMLAEDMIKADVSLTDEEWLQYIDALQISGNLATAAEKWESQKSRLGSKENVASEFWMIGVRLYVALGRPQKAQKLAFECHNHSSKVDPEILVAVITAWARTHGVNAEERAWSCYLELRKRLESQEFEESTLELLGSVSSILLENGHRQLALAVFKDMYTLRVESPSDSWKVFKNMTLKAGDSEAPSEDFISKIGLASLAFLPKTFNNKFFFAAWIKWLLGQGQIDDATMVVELMYERGIRPDARHLNGIIAAWLRDGTPSACEKAEATAWAMVRARTHLVYSRFPPQKASESSIVEQIKPRRNTPVFVQREAAPATIETFSILLLYYTRRSNLESVDLLSKIMLGPAQIKPNSFIMNHWMYASLRAGKIPEVWKTYSAFKGKLQPDLETFAALWDTAKKHFGSPAAHLDNVPSPRHLFKEMMEWHQSLEPKKKVLASEEFSADFYRQIIRCFCFTDDLEGTLCALHELHRTFDILPHEEVSRLIITQVARSFPSVLDAARRARLLKRRGPLRIRGTHTQATLKAVTEIVVAIMEKKVDEQDLDPELLEDGEDESEEAQALRLDVLSTFLCMVLERRRTPSTGTSLTVDKNVVHVETVTTPQKVGKSDDLTLVQAVTKAANEMRTAVPTDLLARRDWVDL